MLQLDVGRHLDPPLTERETRAVVELIAAMKRAVEHRLPLSLELVELDVELRRRAGVVGVNRVPSSARRRRL
jgi:hypothetical protein